VGDETHYKGYEDQAKHGSHEVEEGEENCPNQDYPINPGKFVNAEGHDYSVKAMILNLLILFWVTIVPKRKNSPERTPQRKTRDPRASFPIK
jgi:hypothetical protein